MDLRKRKKARAREAAQAAQATEAARHALEAAEAAQRAAEAAQQAAEGAIELAAQAVSGAAEAAQLSARQAVQAVSEAAQAVSDVAQAVSDAVEQGVEQAAEAASETDASLNVGGPPAATIPGPDEGAEAADRAEIAEVMYKAAAERAEIAEAMYRAALTRGELAQAMEKAAAERAAALEAREKAAAERDATANARDRIAGERDSIANARDRAAVERGAVASPRPAAGPDGTAEVTDDAALERARLEAELQRAHLDALTGVYRREMGRLALRNEIERARRADGKFVIAFIDVDGLKGVNDRDGHAAGDRILRTLAATMRANLRSYDPIVRFGGDEFICGIASVDPVEVQHRITVIDQSMRNATGVGITAGLATLTANESLDELTARADAALLEAKRSRTE